MQNDSTDKLVFQQMPGEFYYFAYGSNMNGKQISSHCINPVEIGLARLPNYRIGFYGYSKRWDGAMETVIPDPGQDVWGVIYRLTFSDGEKLDAWQGVRMDGSGAYFHYPAMVIDTKERAHTVLFYKKDVLGEPQFPSTEYLQFIVEGALKHELPPIYIDRLRQIKSKKARFVVPLSANEKQYSELSMSAICSDCQPSADSE